MKITAVCFVSLFAASFAMHAQSLPAKAPQNESPDQIKRLGSVTWDLETHKLIWVVQKGTVVNGKFAPASEQRYEVSPDEATMSVAEQKRSFGEDEALSLHQLLDVLSVYCAESVVWWDRSNDGTTDERHTLPTKPARPAAPSPKPDTVSDPKPVKVADPMPSKAGHSPVRYAAVIRPF